MREALFYRKINKGLVQCNLCPHNCRIKDSETGICKVRINRSGKLLAKSFSVVSALHSDPVEKKPLFHFFPGSRILSIGSFGCNLQCRFCQNWEISQCLPDNVNAYRKVNADQVIQNAFSGKENIGIAFTYNEPVVNIEFIMELAMQAKAAGMKTAFISNGYINEEPLKELLSYIDAFNIDLKVFLNSIYNQFTGARLRPVLRTLNAIRESGRHIEITHLVVPSMNDSIELFNSMIDWISSEMGELTVLHVSRYFPGFQMNRASTSTSLLNHMYTIARNKLPYTYIGNVALPGASDTFCHRCHSMAIRRDAYTTTCAGLDKNGNCLECGQNVISYI